MPNSPGDFLLTAPAGLCTDLRREVQLDLSTHAVGGLTLPDFIMASKIDAVKADYSPKWLEKNPAAAGTAVAPPAARGQDGA